jgi:hypothetical protein
MVRLHTSAQQLHPSLIFAAYYIQVTLEWTIQSGSSRTG